MEVDDLQLFLSSNPHDIPAAALLQQPPAPTFATLVEEGPAAVSALSHASAAEQPLDKGDVFTSWLDTFPGNTPSLISPTQNQWSFLSPDTTASQLFVPADITGAFTPVHLPPTATATTPTQTQLNNALPSSIKPSALTDKNVLVSKRRRLDPDMMDPEPLKGTSPSKVDVPSVDEIQRLFNLPMTFNVTMPSPKLNDTTLTSPASPTTSNENHSSSPSSTPTQAKPKSTPGPTKERTKIAAEERRRRNTAASQRFRLRKKAKEREMEAELSDLREKVKLQQDEILHLRRENKALRLRLGEDVKFED